MYHIAAGIDVNLSGCAGFSAIYIALDDNIMRTIRQNDIKPVSPLVRSKTFLKRTIDLEYLTNFSIRNIRNTLSTRKNVILGSIHGKKNGIIASRSTIAMGDLIYRSLDITTLHDHKRKIYSIVNTNTEKCSNSNKYEPYASRIDWTDSKIIAKIFNTINPTINGSKYLESSSPGSRMPYMRVFKSMI